VILVSESMAVKDGSGTNCSVIKNSEGKMKIVKTKYNDKITKALK
jgi:hypothetical protein